MKKGSFFNIFVCLPIKVKEQDTFLERNLRNSWIHELFILNTDITAREQCDLKGRKTLHTHP